MKYTVRSLNMLNVCAYLHDINNSYVGVDIKVFEDFYIPIINQFEINRNAGIKFRYCEVNKKQGTDSLTITTNVSKDIDAYSSNGKYSALMKSVVEKNKYTIDKGDLILGPQFVILNLTDEPITVYDHLNNTSVFHPIEQEKLIKMAKGKIIVFAIHHITTPINYSKATGIQGNYLKEYLDHYKFNPTQMDKMPIDKFHQSLKLRYFAAQAWDSFVEQGIDLNAPSIKVISVSIIPPNYFTNECSGEEVSVFFRDVDLFFIKSKNHEPTINPACERNSDIMQLRENIVPGTPCIFMVDPDNEIKPRYYALHGRVYEVPKIKSNFRDKGLWIAKFDKNFNIIDETHIHIDDIKKLNFIFETQEEARNFCNFREKQERELKELEAKLKQQQNELKVKKLEAEYETKAKLKKLEEEHLDFKNRLERESLRLKYEFDERKQMYDYMKYKQDYSIETLKTFAAIAGVFATGFVIFKQLNKS